MNEKNTMLEWTHDWLTCTDEELRDLVLEAHGLGPKYPTLIDLDVARLWMQAVHEAENALASYRVAAAMSRSAGQKWVDYSLSLPGNYNQRKANPQVIRLGERREQMIRLRGIRWDQCNAAHERAMVLSRNLFTAAILEQGD